MFVLDTKWKALDEGTADRKSGISQADLYQLLSYATVLRSTEKAESIVLVLVYPRSETFVSPLKMRFNDKEGTDLLVLPFDIARADADGEAYGRELRDMLYG